MTIFIDQVTGRSKMQVANGEQPVTLSHWARWRKDAGVKGKKILAAVSGSEARPNRGTSCGYVWELERKGTKTWCHACGVDFLKGEQSVRPTVPLGVMPIQEDYHPRCVTPEQWAKWLGAPRSGRAQPVKNTPINDKTVGELVEQGVLDLSDGVTLPEAVDTLREMRGQKPLKR